MSRITALARSDTLEASIALLHRHAGERESGGNVRRMQWACLYFNQGDLVRDWSKPSDALLDEFDFRWCHWFVHFFPFRVTPSRCAPLEFAWIARRWHPFQRVLLCNRRRPCANAGARRQLIPRTTGVQIDLSPCCGATEAGIMYGYDFSSR